MAALLALLFATVIFSAAFLLPMGQLLTWIWQGAWRDLDARYWQLLGNTLLLGGGAALLTSTVALYLAVVRKQWPSRATRAALRLATMGYAMPGSVLAVGVMLALVWADSGLATLFQGWLGGTWGGWMSGSVLALYFAYLVRFLAVAHGPIESSLERIRPNLSEAAQSLGSSPVDVVRRIYLPILRPALLTAVLMVVVEVMKEMPATLLLRPFGWNTLAVRVYEMTSEGEWERAALPAVTLVVAGIIPVVLLIRQTNRH